VSRRSPGRSGAGAPISAYGKVDVTGTCSHINADLPLWVDDDEAWLSWSDPTYDHHPAYRRGIIRIARSTLGPQRRRAAFDDHAQSLRHFVIARA
jgi:hypothetical protein